MTFVYGGISFAEQIEPPPFAQATAEYRSLNGTAKSRFAHTWLVDRFEASAGNALAKRALEKQRARYARIMARINAGQNLNEAGLVKLLTEVAAVERRAIEQLSLEYRIQVYKRYRNDRAEYDRRMTTWRKLLADWDASSASAEQATLALAWLKSSLERMRQDELAELPTLPRFEEADPSGSQPRCGKMPHGLPALDVGDLTVQRRAMQPAIPRLAMKVASNPTQPLVSDTPVDQAESNWSCRRTWRAAWSGCRWMYCRARLRARCGR